MKKITLALLIIIWFSSGYIPSVGWMNAQAKSGWLGNLYDRERCGKSYAVGLLGGVIGPLGALQAYFLSGFAEHGFDMSCKKGEL